MQGLVLCFAILAFQDPFEERVDRCLAEFKAKFRPDDFAGRMDSIHELAESLSALGEGAVPIIERRLIEELRQGKCPEDAEGFYRAIKHHPDAAVPLRSALQDRSFSVAGQCRLATILIRLKDNTSWRSVILEIVKNDRVPMDERVRAVELYEPSDEDPELRSVFQAMVGRLAGYPENEQISVVAFLSRQVKWMRDLDGEVMRDQRLQPEIRLFAIKSLLLAGDGTRYPAMFEVIDELRVGQGEAARIAEALSVKLSDQRPKIGLLGRLHIAKMQVLLGIGGAVALVVLLLLFHTRRAT